MTWARFAVDTVGLVGTIMVVGFLIYGLRSLRDASPDTGSQQIRDLGYIMALALLTVAVTTVIAAIVLHTYDVPTGSAEEFIIFMGCVVGGSSLVVISATIMLALRRKRQLEQEKSE
jgi:peptidoglycan biosynthesis protein MviN/MurJ (putative lipid II flippase)